MSKPTDPKTMPPDEGYLKDLRNRDTALAQGWGQIAPTLRMSTPGGMQDRQRQDTGQR